MIDQDSSSPDYTDHFPNQTTAADNSRSKPLLELFSQITALATRLRQRADLPHAEHSVLEMLNRFGPMTVPQIARARSTSRQNIQILIDRLEALSRVEFKGNPAHKKSALVGLTEKGKASLQAGEHARKDLLVDLGSRLSETEVRGATSVLSKVRVLLSSNRLEPLKDEGDFAQSPVTKQINTPDLSADVGTDPQVEEFPINLL